MNAWSAFQARLAMAPFFLIIDLQFKQHVKVGAKILNSFEEFHLKLNKSLKFVSIICFKKTVAADSA